MEINELIKSNIFLISLYAGLILLIALIIYLVRNKAREKALSYIDTEADEIDLDDSEGIVSIQKLKNNALPLNKEITNIFTENVKRKFVVINKTYIDNDSNNINDRRDHEFKEVYESTASKLMFKFNPRSVESEE